MPTTRAAHKATATDNAAGKSSKKAKTNAIQDHPPAPVLPIDQSVEDELPLAKQNQMAWERASYLYVAWQTISYMQSKDGREPPEADKVRWAQAFEKKHEDIMTEVKKHDHFVTPEIVGKAFTNAIKDRFGEPGPFVVDGYCSILSDVGADAGYTMDAIRLGHSVQF